MSPAMSPTRSHSPLSITPSMIRAASSWIRGRMALAARGMNSPETSLRWVVWRGGSIVIIIW